MIKYTEHSERKILQRGLKKESIEKTLENPEFIIESYSGRKVAYRKFGKLYLAVVFKVEGQNLIVVTTHWDKNFNLKGLVKKGELI